jgi:hypothetical protein
LKQPCPFRGRGLFLTVAAIVLMCFSMTGCMGAVKMYSDADGDPRTQATIRVEDRGENGEIILCITRVDGKETTWAADHGQCHTREVYVLPGNHYVKAEATQPFLFGYKEAKADLWLAAEPQGLYVIKVLPARGAFRIWIKDERSGRTVGGVAGSDDAPPRNNK